jgi:hypothetical protein
VGSPAARRRSRGRADTRGLDSALRPRGADRSAAARAAGDQQSDPAARRPRQDSIHRGRDLGRPPGPGAGRRRHAPAARARRHRRPQSRCRGVRGVRPQPRPARRGHRAAGGDRAHPAADVDAGRLRLRGPPLHAPAAPAAGLDRRLGHPAAAPGRRTRRRVERARPAAQQRRLRRRTLTRTGRALRRTRARPGRDHAVGAGPGVLRRPGRDAQDGRRARRRRHEPHRAQPAPPLSAGRGTVAGRRGDRRMAPTGRGPHPADGRHPSRPPRGTAGTPRRHVGPAQPAVMA